MAWPFFEGVYTIQDSLETTKRMMRELFGRKALVASLPLEELEHMEEVGKLFKQSRDATKMPTAIYAGTLGLDPAFITILEGGQALRWEIQAVAHLLYDNDPNYMY